MSVPTDSLRAQFFWDMTLCNWIVSYWHFELTMFWGSKYSRKITGHSDPWRQGHYTASKCLGLITQWCNASSHKNWIISYIAAKNSKPTHKFLSPDNMPKSRSNFRAPDDAFALQFPVQQQMKLPVSTKVHGVTHKENISLIFTHKTSSNINQWINQESHWMWFHTQTFVAMANEH